MIKSLSVSAAILVAIAITGVQTLATASEQAPSPPAKSDVERAPAGDCSQQVWPHISAACLRNAESKIEVRLVASARR